MLFVMAASALVLQKGCKAVPCLSPPWGRLCSSHNLCELPLPWQRRSETPVQSPAPLCPVWEVCAEGQHGVL